MSTEHTHSEQRSSLQTLLQQTVIPVLSALFFQISFQRSLKMTFFFPSKQELPALTVQTLGSERSGQLQIFCLFRAISWNWNYRILHNAFAFQNYKVTARTFFFPARYVIHVTLAFFFSSIHVDANLLSSPWYSLTFTDAYFLLFAKTELYRSQRHRIRH